PAKPLDDIGDVVTASATADDPRTEVDDLLYASHLCHTTRPVHTHAVPHNGKNHGLHYVGLWGGRARRWRSVCLVAFLGLSSYCLIKFMRKETVKTFEVNESAAQEFAVTICKIQESIFKEDDYLRITGRPLRSGLENPTEALTADFPWGSADLEQAVWNMTHSWGDIVHNCADFYNNGCNRSAVTSELYQYGGQCHTVRYSDALAEGVQRGIWLGLHNPNCTSCGRHHWNVYVHSVKDHYMDWEHVWAPPRAQMESGKEQNFIVTRILDIRLPSDTHPCNTDPTYSQPNCIRQCLFSELAELGPGCRLPWMPVKLPVCDTARDYQLLLNYTRMFSRTHIVWHQNSEQLRANEYYAALKSTCQAGTYTEQ
ncbi:uncharacterized protein LOC122374630, partial [Amphibalanus amphitrite]|uniref:uncharacterized protein LOC122374630 n=1 Tax=Amphibalanus amphitrite TaxID=1232801 RepID=UPI001C92748D